MGVFDRIRDLFSSPPEEVVIEDPAQFVREVGERAQSELARRKAAFLKGFSGYLERLAAENAQLARVRVEEKQEKGTVPNERVDAIADGNRNAYSTGVARLVESLQERMGLDEPFDAFLSGVLAELSEFKSHHERNIARAQILFRAEMGKVSSTLNMILRACNDEQEALRGVLARRDAARQIEEYIAERSSLIERRTRARAREKTLRVEREEVESQIAEHEAKIEGARSGDAYRRMQEAQERRDALRAELVRNARRIRDAVPEKALTAYLYAESDPDRVRIAEAYKEDAVEALMDDTDCVIAKILSDVRERLERGGVVKDTKKRERLLDKISEVADFRGLREERERLFGEVENLERVAREHLEQSGVVGLESELSRLRRVLERLDSERVADPSERIDRLSSLIEERIRADLEPNARFP